MEGQAVIHENLWSLTLTETYFAFVKHERKEAVGGGPLRQGLEN